MTTITFQSLFVFSESDNTYFYKEFNKRINIITGCNTSGKSTLIQSFIYTFGINDLKEKLKEILESKPIFRLDFSVVKNNEIINCTMIRENGSIYFKEENTALKPFHGIDADHSAEKIKYKKFISEFLGFNLFLEQKNEFKPAPLEVLFLPYYISQSVGWVYLRESFANLNFYKNFKEDYLDYYFGITTLVNREELIKLKQQKTEFKAEIKSTNKQMIVPELEVAKLVDETFGDKSQEYINQYVENFKVLTANRYKKVELSNKLSIYESHLKIARRTKKELKNQKYDGIDTCPSCLQVLEHSIEKIYEHYQKVNDNKNIIEVFLKEKINNTQANLNSCNKKIEVLNIEIQENYEVLSKLESQEINFETWLDIKASSRLYTRLENQKISLDEQLEDVTKKLSNHDDSEIKSLRYQYSSKFEQMFKQSLVELGVKELEEQRYLDVYQMNSFPYQGVELHSTILAYHICFNKLINENKNIHRLPFLLDGILKEDIDPQSLDIIFKFVSKNLPIDTQSFLSISDYKYNESKNEEEQKKVTRFTIEQIRERYFNEDTEIITISKGNKRSFLSQELDNTLAVYEETINIIS